MPRAQSSLRVRVKATARVLGLQSGQIAEVEPSPYVDMLVQHGWLIWLDRPADAPIVTPPPASERGPVSRRGSRSKPEVVAEPEPESESEPFRREDLADMPEYGDPIPVEPQDEDE